MANAEHLKILKQGVEVWNKWRKEQKYLGPDLSSADLSEMFIPGTNLAKANLGSAKLINTYLRGSSLRECNFIDSALSQTNFQGSNFIGSNFRNATIVRADFSDSDLTECNFRGAKIYDTKFNNATLFGANFTKTTLVNVDFSECNFSRTVLGYSELSDCIGLSTIRVELPCVIDFYTLKISKNIPKSFLLKIGLPELYIDYLPDFFQTEGIRLHPVFLSHSWANKSFARKLYEALIARGVNVFFDEKKMKPGDDIFTGISRGIELYDKTILVCSKDSLNSWWVDQELELVFEKERNLQQDTGEKTGLLIPIKIDEYIETWSNGKRMAIKQRIIGDFRDWQDETTFNKALDDLVHALNADRKEIPPVSYLPRKPQS